MAAELVSLRVPEALLALIDERVTRGEGRADIIRDGLHEYFGLQEEFGRHLAPRQSQGGYYASVLSGLRRDLERYYETLYRARRTLRDQFTGEEQGLIADVLNGTLFADTSAPAETWQEIEDAVRHDEYARKWEVDGLALVAKLKALSYAENAALVDAVERFWARVSKDEPADPRRLLEEVRG